MDLAKLVKDHNARSSQHLMWLKKREDSKRERDEAIKSGFVFINTPTEDEPENSRETYTLLGLFILSCVIWLGIIATFILII